MQQNLMITKPICHEGCTRSRWGNLQLSLSDPQLDFNASALYSKFVDPSLLLMP